MLGYSHKYPKYSRLTCLLHLTSSSSFRDSGGAWRLSGYKPFRCLAFSSAAKHQSPLAGGGAGIYFHPSSALHPKKHTDLLHLGGATSVTVHVPSDTVLGFSRRYPKYSRLTCLLHLTSSSSSRGSGVPGDYQVTSPFAVLLSAWQRSINRHRQGGEREFISIPLLPSIPKNTLIPPIGLIGTPSSFIFLVPPYLSTSELLQMSQNPLPCPPQMMNGGSPPAHLYPSPATLSGPPHWLVPPYT